MSVLIKGMNLPKEGLYLLRFAQSDGVTICLIEESYPDGGGRLVEHKGVVEVPTPHGDLIDRTKLYNDTANWEAKALEEVAKYDPTSTRDDWRWWSAVLGERGAFKHDVADAKTVIEAEVEE